MSRRRRKLLATTVLAVLAFVLTVVVSYDAFGAAAFRLGALAVLSVLFVAPRRQPYEPMPVQNKWGGLLARVSVVRYVLAALAGFLVARWVLLHWLEPALANVGGVAVAMLAAAGLWRFRRRRIEEKLAEPQGMRCGRCGYSLRFNKGRCPECGTPCIAHTGRFADVIEVQEEVM